MQLEIATPVLMAAIGLLSLWLRRGQQRRTPPPNGGSDV